MSISKRLYLVAGLVAVLALAFSAVTLTSRLTSAQGTDPTTTVQPCDQQDEAADAAEAATEGADSDGIEQERGPQDEANDADTDDVQEPQLNGTIAVDEARYEGLSEEEEAAALAPLATITEDEAIAAAQAEVPGSADAVELGNENGSLVYEVKIGGQEVKVDAGNGAVLLVEAND